MITEERCKHFPQEGTFVATVRPPPYRCVMCHVESLESRIAAALEALDADVPLLSGQGLLSNIDRARRALRGEP